MHNTTTHWDGEGLAQNEDDFFVRNRTTIETIPIPPGNNGDFDLEFAKRGIFIIYAEFEQQDMAHECIYISLINYRDGCIWSQYAEEQLIYVGVYVYRNNDTIIMIIYYD